MKRGTCGGLLASCSAPCIPCPISQTCCDDDDDDGGGDDDDGDVDGDDDDDDDDDDDVDGDDSDWPKMPAFSRATTPEHGSDSGR